MKRNGDVLNKENKILQNRKKMLYTVAMNI